MPGTYYVKETKSCKVCPRGTFQQSEGESSCNKCPKHQTTRSKGTRHTNSCEGKMSARIKTHSLITHRIHKDDQTFSYNINL